MKDKKNEYRENKIAELEEEIAGKNAEIIELNKFFNQYKEAVADGDDMLDEKDAEIAVKDKVIELMADRLKYMVIDDQDNWMLSSAEAIIDYYTKQAEERIKKEDE